jgi:gamma-glutamyltranspeptidase
MTAADLEGYRPEWVDTIGIDHADHRLHEIPRTGRASRR